VYNTTMRFTLGTESDAKATNLCATVHGLRLFALDALTVVCDDDKVYMQGLDNSHVCLFEVELHSSWFDEYDFDSKKDDASLAISPSILDKVLGTRQTGQSITVKQESSDSLVLQLQGGTAGNVNKVFTVPLMSVDGYERMDVPPQEYDIDLTVNSKRFSSLIDQLSLFGNSATISSDSEGVNLRTSGDNGVMSARIDGLDELMEYAIVEDFVLVQRFSLRFLKIMTSFNSLCTDVYVGMGDDKPMTVQYELGDKSRVQFFMAPQVGE